MYYWQKKSALLVVRKYYVCNIEEETEMEDKDKEGEKNEHKGENKEVKEKL